MSIKKRVFVVILIAVFIIGTFYAGTRSNREAEENNSLSRFQTETVNLWYSDESLTDLFTNASVAFHEKNPDVRVIPTLVTGGEFLEAINEASIANEGFPDIYLLTNDSLEKAYMSGLASVVDRQGLVINNTNFPDGAINAVTYDGDKIAYPLYFETSVLVYNIDYLKDWAEKVNAGESNMDGEMSEEEMNIIESEGSGVAVNDENAGAVVHEGDVMYEDGIPKNFRDILSLAQEYDTPEGVEGIIKWDVSDIFYNYFFVGNYLNVGGEAGDDVSNIDVANNNSVACMQMYQSLHEFFSIDAETSDYNSVVQDFIDGKYIFSIVTSDAIKTLADAKAEMEEEAKAKGVTQAENAEGEESEEAEGSEGETVEEPVRTLDYGFALMPDVSEELKSRSLSVTDCLVINRYSEKKDGAAAFAKFLCVDYADQIYARAGKLAASLDAGYTDDAFTTFQGEYAKSIPLSKIVEASNLWVQIEVVFKEVWDGADVKTELNSLQNQLDLQINRESKTEE